MSDGVATTVETADLSPAGTNRARGFFLAGAVWLGYLAVVLHFHERVDDGPIFWAALSGLAILTPLFWGEALWCRLRQSANARHVFWSAVLPPLRLGVRDPQSNTQIWLPRLGWRTVDARLQHDVSQALSAPMLGVSLLVLPVILVEFLLAERLDSDQRLARATQFATSLIWWAFAFEFIVMVSVTDKRLNYCKKHWLDLAIILLPLLAFLRALRLGRLLRLHNLSKTARMYKLRGVVMRTYRALLLIEAIQRLMHGSPERRLEKLRHQLAVHEEQADLLRSEISKLESQTAALPQESAA